MSDHLSAGMHNFVVLKAAALQLRFYLYPLEVSFDQTTSFSCFRSMKYGANLTQSLTSMKNKCIVAKTMVTKDCSALVCQESKNTLFCRNGGSEENNVAALLSCHKAGDTYI